MTIRIGSVILDNHQNISEKRNKGYALVGVPGEKSCPSCLNDSFTFTD